LREKRNPLRPASSDGANRVQEGSGEGRSEVASARSKAMSSQTSKNVSKEGNVRAADGARQKGSDNESSCASEASVWSRETFRHSLEAAKSIGPKELSNTDLLDFCRGAH